MANTKILKTCNCCLTHKAQVRLMGTRANKAWCHSCKVPTYWTAMDDEQVAAYSAKRAATEAFIEKLMSEIE